MILYMSWIPEFEGATIDDIFDRELTLEEAKKLPYEWGAEKIEAGETIVAADTPEGNMCAYVISPEAYKKRKR